MPQGQFKDLIDRLVNAHLKKNGKEVDPADISKFIYSLEKQSTERRAFTGEEVENIKNLIQQQGRLEFRILANKNDDKDAIAAAEEYMKDPKNADRLKDLNVKGEPPPPPTQNGDRYFTVNLHDESTRQEYSWVEMGKEELYSHAAQQRRREHARHRPRQATSYRKAIWKEVEDGQATRRRLRRPARLRPSMYCRTITNLERISPRDREQGKKVEFFVLTRESEPGTEVTGDFLTSVSSEGRRRRQKGGEFHLQQRRRQPLLRTHDRKSSRRVPIRIRPSSECWRSSSTAKCARRPTLNAIISSQGQISGDFTQKAIEDLVRILRRRPAGHAQTAAGERKHDGRHARRGHHLQGHLCRSAWPSRPC